MPFQGKICRNLRRSRKQFLAAQSRKTCNPVLQKGRQARIHFCFGSPKSSISDEEGPFKETMSLFQNRFFPSCFALLLRKGGRGEGDSKWVPFSFEKFPFFCVFRCRKRSGMERVDAKKCTMIGKVLIFIARTVHPFSSVSDFTSNRSRMRAERPISQKRRVRFSMQSLLCSLSSFSHRR